MGWGGVGWGGYGAWSVCVGVGVGGGRGYGGWGGESEGWVVEVENVWAREVFECVGVVDRVHIMG